MEKFKVITLLLFCCGFHTAFAEQKTPSSEPNQPDYAKLIEPDKLKEDLDFLFKTIEEVHPNMYAYTTKDEFTKYRDELYNQIDRPMTRLELYKLTAPVVASLKNGHTQLYMPDKDFKEYLSNGGKILPIEFRWDRDILIIDKNYGKQDLPVGGTVLKIDSYNAENLITKFARYFPDEFKDNNPGWAAKGLMHCLWLEYGQTEHLDLYVRAADGTEKAYKVKGIPFVEFQANKAKGDVDNRQPYSYRYMPEYNTGIIELRVCRNDVQYKNFLKNVFSKIKAKNIPYLIVDIRNNPGGNSNAGENLLNYLTDKPFRQYEQYSVKASAQVMKLQYIKQDLPENVKIGSVVTHKVSFINPEDNPNPFQFNGNKFVLIGPVTFSSANCLASAIKCFNIATLVGEESGGTTTCYGDIFSIKLPHSDLSAGCSMKYFVEACGKPDGRGVIPDYEVKQKPEDTAKGTDTVLQFTLDLIKKANHNVRSDSRNRNKTIK